MQNGLMICYVCGKSADDDPDNPFVAVHRGHMDDLHAKLRETKAKRDEARNVAHELADAIDASYRMRGVSSRQWLLKAGASWLDATTPEKE